MKKNYIKKNQFKFIFVILISIMFGHLWATDYYVDAVNGNNSNSGLSTILAKQTIQSAANLTLPGDTVYIMNGTYEVTSVNGNVLNMTRSGAPGQYITFKI